MKRQQYAVGLLLDGTARSGHRIPRARQIDTLVREIHNVTGSSKHARRCVVVAYRTPIAMEAPAVGRVPVPRPISRSSRRWRRPNE
ncbi:hypothetical protein ACFYXH_38885 [Streptomyces sp. NPDC002730]|uniref:hypothetical protein n=1 Tax=Streptomyces sp. NPDC002730 TaxID=3364662 RepID=UPI0036CA8D9E